jgi:hypothetical protein
MKYNNVKIILILRNGSSTGLVPNQVKNIKIIKKFQKDKAFRFLEVYWKVLLIKAKGSNIKIDIKRPITPPNLLGIARKIA